jgi:hypothetical protein
MPSSQISILTDTSLKAWKIMAIPREAQPPHPPGHLRSECLHCNLGKWSLLSNYQCPNNDHFRVSVSSEGNVKKETYKSVFQETACSTRSHSCLPVHSTIIMGHVYSTQFIDCVGINRISWSLIKCRLEQWKSSYVSMLTKMTYQDIRNPSKFQSQS